MTSAPPAEAASGEHHDPDAPAVVDTRLFASGAVVRFVLLIVLIVASTATLVPGNILFSGLLGDPGNDAFGCQMAAGFDPTADYAANEAALDGVNAPAFHACVARYAAPWWGPYVAVLAVLALAAVLWWLTPVVVRRRRRLTPLSGPVRAELQSLVATVGLTRTPEFLVDPARGDTAVTWGRPGAYAVVVGSGLRTGEGDAQRRKRRAIVLHELAHLRNGDVGISQAAVALWRVFAVTMLLPFLVEELRKLALIVFTDHSAPTEAFFSAGPTPELISLFLGIGTAVLVYLSRVDIQRSREFHADHLAVVGWDADPSPWSTHREGESRRRTGWRERWRIVSGTHPTWRARWSALQDPTTMLRPRGLTAFLTGAAAMLVALGFRITTTDGGPGTIPGLVLAGLLTAGVIGLTAWPTIRGDAPRWEMRWGLLLGLGFVAASAFAERTLEPRAWLGGDGWGALGLLFAGVTITAWAVAGLRGARLVQRRWWRRVSAAAVLIVAGLLVAFAFRWTATLVDIATGNGLELTEHTAESVFGVAPRPVIVLVALAGMLGYPVYTVVLLPATATWLVPLVLRSFAAPDRRRVSSAVVGALTGAVVCAVVIGMGADGFGISGLVLVLILVVIAGLAPLAVGIVLARDREVGTVEGIAGAGLAGFLQAGVLLAVASVADAASGRHYVSAVAILALTTVEYVPFVALGVVTLTAARSSLRPAPVATTPTWRRGLARSTVVVVGLVSIVLIAATVRAPGAEADAAPGGLPSAPAPGRAVAPQTHDPGVLRAQALAWWRYGGLDLSQRWAAVVDRADKAAQALPTDPNDPPALLGVCQDAQAVTHEAAAYFRVPDTKQQDSWADFVRDSTKGADDCVTALRGHDIPGVMFAVVEIEDSVFDVGLVELWVDSETNP